MFNVTYPPTDPEAEPCPCTMLALEPRPHPNLEPAAARAFEAHPALRVSCAFDGRPLVGTSSGDVVRRFQGRPIHEITSRRALYVRNKSQ